MYKTDYYKVRSAIGLISVLFFLYIFFIVFHLSPALKNYSQYNKSVIASYLSFFIPANIIGWLTMGQIGGIFMLVFTCMSIVLIALKTGVIYYNGYIVLFGIASVFGYKQFLDITSSKNRALARSETLEVDKNTLASAVSKKQTDIVSAKNRVNRYMALKDITEELSSSFDVEAIASFVTEKAFNIIEKSDRAFLFLINESRQELGLVSSKQDVYESHMKAKKGEIFDSWILKQRKTLLVEDIDNDFRFSPEALSNPRDKEYKSVIGVPIMTEMKVIGVLRLDSRPRDVYTQDDLRLLSIISDLAAVSLENAMLYKRTNDLAITDGLTGLYVHRYFKERLNAELKRALAGEKQFSILMIDLDHFKEKNDKYGHTVGDLLLVKVAQILKGNVDTGHIVSRYGGEEFAIFLFGTDIKGAVKIAQALRKKVEDTAFIVRRFEVKMTVSIGISSFPDDGYLVEELLKTADENLYKAKENGRNKVWSSSI